MKSEPIDFLIIGAQKAGTTTLHEILRRHPDLELPPGKEHPILNDPRLSDGEAENQLRDLFHVENGRLRGKATPQYISSPLACDRLKKMAPNTRIIAILRDPVERFYSHYRMVLRRNDEGNNLRRDVEDLLQPEALNFARSNPPVGRVNEKNYSVIWGEYGRMLSSYFAQFNRGHILILRSQDLETAPNKVVSQILEFLGLDGRWDHPVISSKFNQGGDSPIVDLKKIKKVPLLGPALTFVHRRLPRGIQFFILTNNIKVAKDSLRLSHPDVAHLLEAHYDNDQQLLNKLIGS